MSALPPNYPATLVEAVERLAGVTGRGFTFLGANDHETVMSFDALRTRSGRIDAGLRAAGVQPGDRVALVLPDAEDFVPTFLGSVRGGGIPVPFYPPTPFGRLPDYVDHLTRMLSVADPVVLVTTKRMSGPFSALVEIIPSLRQVVTLEDLTGQADPAEPLPAAVAAHPDDPVFLQFTSGSTANPKGVVVTHRSLAANSCAIVRDGLGVREDDIGLSWLPLYHDMGLIGFVLSPIFLPTPVVFLPTLAFLRNPTAWFDEIDRRRATITFAPNFAFGLLRKRGAHLADTGRWDLSCLRVVGCGAEPINAGTIAGFLDAFEGAGLRRETFLPCYGMAEATLAMSFPEADEVLRVEALDEGRYELDRVAQPVPAGESGYTVVGCGRALPGHEVAVLDADGMPVAERHVGQLAFRGPSVTAGYFRDPEATAAAFTDGWLLTGDLGYVSDGEVFVTGREKDLLVIRGRNTDPQHVEWVAEQVRGVRPGNVVAFTRPGEETEELVLVFEAEDLLDAATLGSLVTRRVAESLQLPVADIVALDSGELPKTSSGKVQRQRVRSWYLQRAREVQPEEPARATVA